MANALDVRLKLVSGPISVPISNGEPDLGKLVQQHSALLSAFVGKDGMIYLGVLYDLRPNPSDFDPTKANINSGRYNLPLTVNSGENGLKLLVTDADLGGIKEFLKQRAELEQKLEGTKREYANAMFYQAE